MKRLFAFFVLLPAFLSLAACMPANKIVDTEGNLSATLAKSGMIERLETSSFILLGEKHDNPAHHTVQSTVLMQLLTANDGVVFEMLNKDQQPVIDKYLAGTVSLEKLPEALNWKASGWPEWAFYSPLFKAAKDAGARILYGSYPRRDLKSKMKGGNSNLTPLPSYLQDDLLEEIKVSHCDLLPKEMIAPMSNVQIAKDMLLAKQLVEVKGSGRAFLIAGTGHVRKDRAVPFYLDQLAPQEGVFVLGIMEDRETVSDDTFIQFDTIWITESTPDKDYCAGLRKKFGK